MEKEAENKEEVQDGEMWLTPRSKHLPRITVQ